jgi:beta-glucosidase
MRIASQVGHHLLVAHGLAVQAIRAADPTRQVGIVLSLWGADPASDDPADIAAAEAAWEQSERAFTDPIFRGHYPAGVYELLGEHKPKIQDGDLALSAQKLDFLGINYYSRNVISANGQIHPVTGSEYTEMGWEVHPPALRRILNRIHRDYHLPPVYITENGAAFRDEVGEDGFVHDPRRLAYLKDHFIQTRLAMQDGVDVRGYFVWSLFDNFEWGHGFTKRFGIIRVDYDTQERIIKDSGKWYANVIRSNSVAE